MKTPRTLLSRILAACIAAALFWSATASAATFTWDANGAADRVADGAGTWNTTAGNAVWWDGATNVLWSNSGPNDAIFGNNTGAAGTVTIGSAITVGNLTFNPAGSGNYALTAANDSLPLTFSGATPTITTNASATISARVVSSNGFVKEGLGTLTLKGSNAGGTQNAIGGTITVNAGTLVIGPQFAFSGQAAVQGHLTLANLARFRMVQGNFLSDTGVITVGTDAYAEINEFGDDVGAIAGSGRINIVATSVLGLRSGTQDFTGVISGAGGIFLTNGGVNQTLSGANLYTGSTSIQSGGTSVLTLNHVNAVQNSTLTGVFSATKVVFGLAGTNTYNLGGLAGSGSLNIGANTISVGANNASNSADAIISGSGSLTKVGAATLTLSGASTYTGATTIAGGTIQLQGGGALSSSVIAFTGSGGFSINGGLRTVGALTRTAGNATITSTHNGANTSLTFSSLPARTAGATGNFVVSGGANGTTNRIVLTGATPGFIDHGSFFGGNNFAWYDATGYVRAIQYNGVEGVSTAGGISLASATHQETTAPVESQSDVTFTTLKITGAHAFTLRTTQTVTVDGLLKTGPSATLSGGAGIQASAGQDLVVRTPALADVLTIDTPILANGSNALVKTGLGELFLGALAVNTYTGGTFVNEGRLIATQDSNFGSTAAENNIVLNGGTLQPRTNFTLHANHGLQVGPGGGTIDGIAFGLTLGTANQFSGSGPLAITGNAPTTTVLTSAATQDYFGPMTIGAASLFAGRIMLGADHVTNPFGTGNITVLTGGAGGSSIYLNRLGSVWNNRISLAGNGEGRGAIRAEQGGTFNGDIILTANASISSDGLGTTTTLNGNISGAFTLTLGGQTGANAANQYVLTGNNVHGATTVGLGITRIDRDVALGAYDGTVTLHGNATLQAGADGIILNPDRAVALTGGVSGRHFIDVQAHDMTILGVISGAASEVLVIRGSGSLRLAGANTYTGPTVIDGSIVNVTTLADINTPSSLGRGSAGGSPADLILSDATLRHDAPTVVSTNRVFTIGDAAGNRATIDSSAAAPQEPARFTSTGAIGLGGTGAHELVLGGTNTGANTFTPSLGDAGIPQDPIRTRLTKTGAGTWIIAGANTYTGVTTIEGGILNATILANAGQPSSIGQGSPAGIPQDPARLVIAGGTLRHDAANVAATDRLFTIGGATGNTATIDSSATIPQEPVRFTNPGAIAFGGTGPHELVLGGTNTGANTFTPSLGDTGTPQDPVRTRLTKTGAGTWIVDGANTFTGRTTVSEGTLVAAAAGALGGTSGIIVETGGTLLLRNTATTDRIHDAASVTLSGGRIALEGNVTEGSSPGIGALTLTADSIIDFAGGDGSLHFSDSHAETWLGTLSIYHWTSGSDHLLLGTVDHPWNGTDGGLTASQLAQISFYSGEGIGFLGTGRFLPGGFGEIVPIPEPTGAFTGLALLALAGWRERRKSATHRRETRRSGNLSTHL